ncbi:SDR family NAD(P)-dependent oxidoreductase [Microbacterium sp. LWH3-1.2]|uniref:SDR family NAD(P)-dependent oxidoreductase n=1 Tax=Microbacterium sp. LWH3-1.2 TaxID=3135256 RepID=UPI003444D0AC
MAKNGGAVFITGAAGGIGSAAARRLAGLGRTVFAGVRKAADARAFDGVSGVVPIVVDVLDEESITRAAAEVERRLGGAKLGAVVNNAGIIVQGPVELVPPSELERQFRVNVYGPASVIRAFGPRIRKDAARVVNVSAPTARRAVPHLGPISASKAALESLSTALRVELAPWGCDVVIVEPTAASTAVFSKADAAAADALGTLPAPVIRAYQGQLTAVAEASAGQKLADPDDVAKVLVEAITARRPKTVYYAGRGANVLPMLSRLPDRLGDRVIAGNFGLSARVAR